MTVTQPGATMVAPGAAGRQWKFTITAPAAPKTGKAWWATLNGGHLHTMTVYKRTNAWRLVTREAAIISGLATLGGRPRVQLQRARIDMEFRFPARARGGNRRDLTTNWAPTQKAIIDTLTADTRRVPKVPSLGILVDDSPGHLCCESCPHMRIGEPIEPGPRAPIGLVVVTLTELDSDAVAP